MKKVLCGGISTCDVYVKGLNHMPPPGTAVEIDDIFFQMGGGATNAMVDYSILGGECILCLRIGRDFAGKLIQDTLQKHRERIDTHFTYDEGPTAISMAMIGDRDRSFACLLGTTLKFCREDIPEEKLLSSDIVYISGGCLMHGFDCPDLTDFFRHCKELGKLTVLDTAPDMRNKWLTSIEEALPYIDYYIPSLAEAEAMCGLRDVDKIVDFFVQRGTTNIILKMGAEGVYVRTPDHSRKWVPGFKVTAVDTTGAGDSFCAGFCYGLANDWDIERCIRFGNAVGAMCVSEIGASAGIRSADNVQSFIDEYERKDSEQISLHSISK